MPIYQIAADDMIDGMVLKKDIRLAHSIDIGDSFSFNSPRDVNIFGFDEVDFTNTVLAHDPEIISMDNVTLYTDFNDATVTWMKRTATNAPAALIDGVAAVPTFGIENGIGVARLNIGPFDTAGPHTIKIGKKTLNLTVRE